MTRQPPYMIGIAGGSCAGKSWLAGRLGAALGNAVARLSLDDFYLDRGHLSLARRARLNFDHPRAIDWRRLEAVLSVYRAGAAAPVPRYDFTTHRRLAAETTIAPAPAMIVEGLWLFRRPALRELFDLKVFIRASAELSLGRRLGRDVSERGRTRAQVREQWERQTAPMFWKFVAPQERWADVVLEAPVRRWDTAALAERIESDLTKAGIGI